MDRWLQNDWILRMISLALAILLWSAVTDTSLSSPSNSTHIREATVQVKYDKEHYDLVRKPQKVELIVEGNPAFLEHFSTNYRLYVDARDIGTGTHLLPVQVEGLPFAVDARVEPARVDVTLAAKLQKEMHVEPELIGNVTDGFKAGIPAINPDKVLVKGTEAKLRKVTSVKAIVYLNKETKAINQVVELQAYGENGPLSNVEIEPKMATVQIPISVPSKTVPVSIGVGKAPPPEYAVASLKANVDQITVYGPKSYLDHLQFYTGPKADLSDVTKDTTMVMPVPVHNPAIKVEPKEVEIYVKMVPAETKVIKNVPLELTGLNGGMNARILSPSDAKLNITLSGAPKQIDQIHLADVRALVDVSNLDRGVHDVPIRFVLPSYVQVVGQDNLKVKIQIFG
jgi:YbbR domain-containing protein